VIAIIDERSGFHNKLINKRLCGTVIQLNVWHGFSLRLVVPNQLSDITRRVLVRSDSLKGRKVGKLLIIQRLMFSREHHLV